MQNFLPSESDRQVGKSVIRWAPDVERPVDECGMVAQWDYDVHLFCKDLKRDVTTTVMRTEQGLTGIFRFFEPRNKGGW